MKRILIVIAYDGTDFCGFAMQKDPAVPTIERELNKAVSELTGENIFVTGASRTDSGVHALCNYATFDTNSRIPAEKFAPALNTRLPESIRIRQSKEVELSFNPRNAVTVKTYEYKIYTAAVPDPVLTRYAAYTWFRLDEEKMQEAAQYLVGEHDFKSFANVATNALTTVREILQIEIEKEEIPVPHIMYSRKNRPAEQDRAYMVTIRVTGKGFLYNMVRIIAGTLIEVGRGMRTPGNVREMLEARDRQAAGPTAPSNGLMLVDYRIVGMKE